MAPAPPGDGVGGDPGDDQGGSGTRTRGERQTDGPAREPLNTPCEQPTNLCGPLDSLETSGRPPRDVTTPSDAHLARGRRASSDAELPKSPNGVAAAATKLEATGPSERTPAEATKHAVQPPATATWGDKVRETQPDQPPALTADQVRGARMLQGVWNPLHIKQLTETLITDWIKPSDKDWTADEREMRTLALAPAKANRDDSIRPWTGQENETLVTYLAGGLDLPHPPNFIKEVMVAERCAMLEDFHDHYLDVTLTANLPPTVRLSKHVPHADLFKELFQANTDSRFGVSMLRVLQTDVKRLEYDGLHTLRIVFYSRTTADRWVFKSLRFQRAVITLLDTARPHDDAIEPAENDGASRSS